MKRLLYPKLAWSGMRKNSKLYVPYILAGVGVAAIVYILMFLANSPELYEQIPGATALKQIMLLGVWVMVVFSVIFMFYTNAFLVRRRYKEFGLYNVLGMNKGNIALVLAWEALISALISIAGGLLLGIAFSKLAELGLLNIAGGKVTLSLSVSLPSLIFTVVFFAGMFLLIYLNSLIKMLRSSATELVRSENYGEKPPKANWLFGLGGVIILGAAYYIAVSIKDPLMALAGFFVAVIMVVIGTYLVFISGSVLLCRLLQRNKRYYYKKNHFVSVSSMTYRMKRNGAGLASVCILATMVLVMISSTTCLFFGTEDTLRNRYPRGICINAYYEDMEHMSEENVAAIRDKIGAAADGADIKNVLDCRSATTYGSIEKGVLKTNVHTTVNSLLSTYSSVSDVNFIPLSDYNAMAGANESLSSGEALVFAYRMDYTEEKLAVDDIVSFKVKKVLDSFPIADGTDMAAITPTLYVIVPDFESVVAKFYAAEGSIPNLKWNYGFDTSLSDEDEIALSGRVRQTVDECGESGDYGFTGWKTESRAGNRQEFYGMYGALFFLGILLSIAFICAAVLIIYYKQISEGYEDSRRFEIMQNVGMTKKEIRSSINSQLLTVFFLPLLFAGLHLGFAFPFIYKLLMLFNLLNLRLLIGTTAISFAVFAVFYAIVYRITSNEYYNIVS